ncbi:glycosyltransferase [Halocella sp. SP3-1]|uniref:glycosyltransferase n=1 Tax=Halocella sp. SP3-1 TaxID=2382161 RepID=UPI000F7627CA|nr:glycosyltransferase [Halocella sp. SP3-1]AZO94023.1 glycosyl transferase [Halocella sp. SP3-1]
MIHINKVLVIAYYFPPLGWSGTQRTLKFVKYMRMFNWEPVVVTVGNSPFPVIDETLEEEVEKSIKIVRIDDLFFKNKTDNILDNLYSYVNSSFDLIESENLKNEYMKEIESKMNDLRSLLMLPDNNIIWANKVLKKISKKVNFDDIDLLYSTSGPYSDHIIAYHIKKLYKKPWVADFRDEWTNNPYYNYNKDSIRFKVEKYLENRIINFADKIVTISRLSKENYVNKFGLEKNKVEVITNGYDEKDFVEIGNKTNKNKFTIVHSGAFYLIRNPLSFIKAINNLINKGKIEKEKIQIEFIGTFESKIKEIVDKNSMDGLIKWIDYLPHKESLQHCIESNMLLLVVGEGENLKSFYTGKVFEYLRTNKPILALSPKGSVVEELMIETGHGKNVEYNDIKGIEEVILDYYIKWQKGNEPYLDKEIIKKYERKNLTRKLVDIFESIIRQTS